MLVLSNLYIQFYKLGVSKQLPPNQILRIIMNYNILNKKEGPPEHLLFEEGDIVLAKCANHSLEPASYDVDEQEVFKVSFIEGSWAYLPVYLIKHLTYYNIKELLDKKKNHHNLVKALMKAEKMIKNLGEKLGGRLKERYDKLYLSEIPFQMEFFGENQVLRRKSIETSMSALRAQIQFQDEDLTKIDDKMTKKRKKFSRCKFLVPFQLAITITSENCILKVWIKMNNFVSQYNQVVQEEPSTDDSIGNVIETTSKKGLQIEAPLEVKNSEKEIELTKSIFEENSTSIEDEGNSEKFMDNDLFKSTMKQIKQGFEKLQKFIGSLKQKNSYKIDERYLNLDGISLFKLESKIRQIFQIMKEYSLTVNQIKLLFDNLNRFLYIFIEYHSATFLLQNIIKIREVISNSKNKEKSLEKVPILNIYEWTNQSFGRWLLMIDKELKTKKSQDKTSKPFTSEINAIDRLKKSIIEVRQKYKGSLSQIRKFFSM